MLETIILLFFSLALLFFIFWRFLRNPDWPKWPTQAPSLKGIKEVFQYKQKKKFYEEGFADEQDKNELNKSPKS